MNMSFAGAASQPLREGYILRASQPAPRIQPSRFFSSDVPTAIIIMTIMTFIKHSLGGTDYFEHTYIHSHLYNDPTRGPSDPIL